MLHVVVLATCPNIGIALAACACLALATPARAQSPEAKSYPDCGRTPSGSDLEAAKGAFAAGQAAFNEGDYPRAIDYWEDAYRRDCTAHKMLLNLARAFELDGQNDNAIVALESYLSRRPDARERDQIARRIDVLRSKTKTDEPVPVAAPTSTEPEATNKPAPAPPTPTPAPADTPAASAKGGKPLVPLIVAGGGALIAAVGGVLYFGAKGDAQDVEDQCGSRSTCSPELADEGNDARSRQQLFGVTAGVGAAVAIGGLVWYLMSPESTTAARTRTRPRASVTPQLGRGFAGVRVGASF